jgi:hypothetical protein
MLFCNFFGLFGQSNLQTKNLIVITLDGLRWQEVFTGADSILLNNKEITKDVEAFNLKYWNSSVNARRQILMPFLWETIAENGQLYGNRKFGTKVNVSNSYWFSYPGYNEIFCGFADNKINSNDLILNPNINVLEVINRRSDFQGKVAAFGSWCVFPYILNAPRSGIMVNAGFQSMTEEPVSDHMKILNEVQSQLPDFIPGARLDAITFQMGFEYLKTHKPRVLYLALDETDDLAHDGRYDLYLNAIHNSDQYIKELWQWLQNQPDYKDETTILITVDHGRGVGNPGWQSHGREKKGSDQTWFAIIGPDTPALGEIQRSGQYYNNQFAQTIAELTGTQYTGRQQTGSSISSVFPEVKKLISKNEVISAFPEERVK